MFILYYILCNVLLIILSISSHINIISSVLLTYFFEDLVKSRKKGFACPTGTWPSVRRVRSIWMEL